MRCELCDREPGVYTGYLNPWYECSSCGAQYCDRCSRGEMPEYGTVSSYDLKAIVDNKTCPRCSGRLQKYQG